MMKVLVILDGGVDHQEVHKVTTKTVFGRKPYLNSFALDEFNDLCKL